MERVQTLAAQLQNKIAANASVPDLLQTVRMLESELQHLQNTLPDRIAGASVMISRPVLPPQIASSEQNISSATNAAQPLEKTVDILQIDDAEIEAELEEIRRNADERNKISLQNKPAVVFEQDEEDIPTLANRRAEEPRREINEKLKTESASVNEKLSAPKPEIAESIPAQPVKDLRKAVGINDRFLFINELFRGDEAMYERSIKTINGFSIFAEAEFWIRRELKLKLGWDEKTEAVKEFDQLIRRRFA